LTVPRWAKIVLISLLCNNSRRDGLGAGYGFGGGRWHDERMVALIMIAVDLLADAVRFSILLFRPTRSVQAENLFLRRQLALFKERGVQPRRIDSATRISLA